MELTEYYKILLNGGYTVHQVFADRIADQSIQPGLIERIYLKQLEVLRLTSMFLFFVALPLLLLLLF